MSITGTFEAMSRILDDANVRAIGNGGAKSRDIAHLSIKMHRQDRFRARRYRRSHPLGLHQERVRIDIHEDRCGPDHFNDICRGDEGHRRNDDLVAASDPEREKGRQCAVRPAVDQQRSGNTEERGKLLLDLAADSAAGEHWRVEHPCDSDRVLPGQVMPKERDRAYLGGHSMSALSKVNHIMDL